MKGFSRVLAQPVQIALVNWVLFGGLTAIAFSFVALLTLDPVVALKRRVEPVFWQGYRAQCLASAFGTPHASLCGRGDKLGSAHFWLEHPACTEGPNAQHETNIHNLWIFQSTEPDGDPKTGLALLLNLNRLLSIFWLTYCVVIPLLVMFSTRRRLTHFFGFPVPRFATGTLFIGNFAMFRFIATYGTMDHDTLAAFDELKETNYEFAFPILAFCLMVRF
jgi:hypothetical protein